MKNNWSKVADIFRFIARYPLLILGMLVFLFALLSGSERYGGGIVGIIKNSPNAIPWLILLILVLIAWKWELIGGIIITVLGIGLFYFFNVMTANFSFFPFILTIIIAILGSFFMVSRLLRGDEEKTGEEKRMKNKRILTFYSVIVIICLVLAGLLAQKHNQKYNLSPESVILQPKDDALVKHQIPAMGIFSQADSAKDLWLIVRSASSTRYHPQPGPAYKTPRRNLWTTTVNFGTPDGTPGNQYYLYLFSATEEAGSVIKDYLNASKEIGQWFGLEDIPAGLTPRDTVAVIRK